MEGNEGLLKELRQLNLWVFGGGYARAGVAGILRDWKGYYFAERMGVGMTEKLFYRDAEMVEFEGEVLECVGDKDGGKYRVRLDRTGFFPEEGGQAADRGTLDGIGVLDVQIEGDVIWHVLGEPVQVGKSVVGKVDWERRFDFMQQHSGEHIVSGLVHGRFGFDNVGFHLGMDEVTLDFNGVLSLEQLREIEREANEAVWRDLPVRVSFPDREELKGMVYRSKIELNGAVRIVEIPGVDVCACCAPHVKSTGQIGMIKVTGVQSHRGGVRVNILCGARALGDYSLRQDSVSAVSVMLSAKQEAVADAVNRLKEEGVKLRERCNGLQSLVLELKMEALPSPREAESVVLFVGDLDTIAMRGAVNGLCERYGGFCGIFAGDADEGYRFIVGSASCDCRDMAARIRGELGGKCGGSAPMIQGSVCASEKKLRGLFE